MRRRGFVTAMKSTQPYASVQSGGSRLFVRQTLLKRRSPLDECTTDQQQRFGASTWAGNAVAVRNRWVSFLMWTGATGPRTSRTRMITKYYRRIPKGSFPS